MENVNKIQIRLDSIKSSAATISIPFGLEFFPIDNTELQQTEFVDKEVEKAINPIFDAEKYPFYPTYNVSSNLILDAYKVEFKVSSIGSPQYFLNLLGLTEDDIVYERNALKKTYLRLNFYDSRDTKIQNLVAKETIHLQVRSEWFSDEKLLPQNTIELSFKANFSDLIYRSVEGEGYHFYWHKNDLPKTLYIRPSIMNAKTGKVINLYSNATGQIIAGGGTSSLPVLVTSGGYNYIKCDFYKDLSKKQQYYYILNSDNLSDVVGTPSPASIQDSVNNTIIITLYPY